MDGDNHGIEILLFVTVLAALLGAACVIVPLAACCVGAASPAPTPIPISADVVLAGGYADAIRTEAESRRDVARIGADTGASVVEYDQMRQTMWTVFSQALTVAVVMFGLGCAWRVRRWNK